MIAVDRSAAGARAIVRTLSSWLVPALLVAAWEIFSRAGIIPIRLLPAPLAVLESGVRVAMNGELLVHLGVSALRAAAGVAIGASLGLVLGLAIGLSHP